MRLIDADALKQKAYLESEGMSKPITDFGVLVEWLVDKQPTIEPQRKKGHWINVRHDNIAECDQCGITGRAWMNFCFDCGADMREYGEAE